MIGMVDFMSFFGEDSYEPIAAINVPLKSALAISNGNTVEVYNVLKSATEDEGGLLAMYDAFKGTYDYNSTTEEFDVTENIDAIVFKFPGKEGDETNTAELKVSGFQVQTISNPRDEFEMIGSAEAPTALKVTLKYSGKEIMTYTLSASYMNDGTPTSLSNILTIGSFVFSQQLTHSNYSEASFDYSFKNGDNVIIAFGAEAKGNWSEENIDANTYEESETYNWWDWEYNESTGQYEEVERTETETWTETDFEEVITNSNAYVQFMNLKAVGKVNIKAMVDGEQAFDVAHENDRDEYGDYPDNIKEAETDNLVTLAEQHVNLVLTYVDKNVLIAAIEPYKVHETDSYTDWNGDTYTYNDYYLDFRMIFNDGTPVSMETFVGDELSGFFDALNDFIGTLNTTYNMNMDEVNPVDDNDQSPSEV